MYRGQPEPNTNWGLNHSFGPKTRSASASTSLAIFQLLQICGQWTNNGSGELKLSATFALKSLAPSPWILSSAIILPRMIVFCVRNCATSNPSKPDAMEKEWKTGDKTTEWEGEGGEGLQGVYRMWGDIRNFTVEPHWQWPGCDQFYNQKAHHRAHHSTQCKYLGIFDNPYKSSNIGNL